MRGARGYVKRALLGACLCCAGLLACSERPATSSSAGAQSAKAVTAAKPPPMPTDKTPLPASFLLSEPPEGMVALNAELSQGAVLLGYSVNEQMELFPGEQATITWYWRLRQAIKEEWSFFSHFIDAQGNLVTSQNNRGALRSRWAPHTWPVNRVVVDSEVITVPSTWASPVLEVRTGLWRGPERMSATGKSVDEENRVRGPKLPVRMRGSLPQGPPLPEVQVFRLSRPPVLDGRVDGDPAWADVAPVAPFGDALSGRSAAMETSLWLGYDARFFYVAMKGFDDTPGGAPAVSAAPGTVPGDAFVVLLRPDAASGQYYEFTIEPSGRLTGYAHSAWRVRDESFRNTTAGRAIIHTSANGGAAYWTAELAIPRQLFDCAPPSESTDKPAGESAGESANKPAGESADKPAGESANKPAGESADKDAAVPPSCTANFFRVDRGASHASFGAWSPPMRGDFHTLEKFGRIQFATTPQTK